MAEVKPTASAAPPAAERRSGTGFELRLERGGAYVRLADRPIAPGFALHVLSMEVPGVRFPFNAGLGAVQFRHVLSDLVRLEVVATAEWVAAAIARLDLAALGLDALTFSLREGFGELAGRLSGGAPFTLHASLLPEGEQGIAVVFHSPRFYGPSPIPAAILPHLAARTFAPFASAPGGVTDPVPRLLRRLTAPRGWKVPRSAPARLALLRVEPDGLRAAWDREPGPPIEPPPQSDLLAAIEGARAFAIAEGHLARGDVDAARDAYLAAGADAHAHPFAADRLLSLLVTEERFHDEALDLALDWLGRRPDFAPALCAEAWVRLARRESVRAARALATLAAAARARGEGGSALAAAEGCVAVAGADPEDVRRAIDAALAVRRDHLPSLRALRALAQGTGDREGLLRANRRLVAYAPDDADKARAHAELGSLLLETDPPAARLHLDQALRLAPDDEEALRALVRACAAAGEHLRAARAIERLRELVLARGDRAAAGRLSFEAGVLWEERLGSDENAYLRYGEAAEELPASAEIHARAARAAERLGRWADAADHHAAVLPLADASTPEGRALVARTRLALAEVAEARLSDPAAAAAHLEAAVAAQPGDAQALRHLAELYRRLSRPADLLNALDRLAQAVEPPAERAALLAEAGALAVSLGRPDAARGRFSAAAALDPACRPALEGMARVAAGAGDAQGEREALVRLLPLAAGPGEEADLQERIADASERAGDLAGAYRAIGAARRAAPTTARLDVALRLARRTGDSAEIATLLAERAQRHGAEGDPEAAARAWLERARLLSEAEPVLAMAAAAEARALAPGDPAVLRAQADLAERLGDARTALGSLRALLAAHPADAGVLEVRAGRAALAASEPTTAREHAERAMAAEAPGAGDLLVAVLDRTGDDAGRAELLERMGRFLEASELWERTQESARARRALERAVLLPGAPIHAIERLAEARLSAGDSRGAAEAFRRLAPLRGGREGALVALRAFAIDPDPAALDAALSCDPTLGAARAERALLRADRDPMGALADCEAALEGSGLSPERRAALQRLGARLAEAAGDEARALEHLEAFCAAAPPDGEALGALARLQRRAHHPGLAKTLARRLPLVEAEEATAIRVELAALLAEQPGREEEALTLLRRALVAHEAERTALGALLRPPLLQRLAPAERLDLLGRLATHPETPAEEAAAAHRDRARGLAEAGDLTGALEAARASARLGPEPDDALELRASLAERAGATTEAAEALVQRARRLVDAADPDGGTRLAEAGLAAVAVGLQGLGEAALRDAVFLGLDRELELPAMAALAAGARSRGEDGAEAEALARLVPLLPTGERPAALLRHAALLRAAGSLAEARAAALEARTLAPRDPSAVELCRALAEEAGDAAEVVDRLAELELLTPARAGELALERARLLVRLERLPEADGAFLAALGALPPDLGLAREHTALRRVAASLAARSAAEPLERFAGRAAGPLASEALREASALAHLSGDAGGALRCARKAWARTRGEPAFAAPLLARLLYLDGSRAEALVLHRTLHEAGWPGIEDPDVVALCRQLAELAADEGDTPLALAALSRLLEARPQDPAALLQRFRLDPDRAAACQALAGAAGLLRSDAQRVDALLRAAAGALLELGDRELAERWFRAARADARRTPRLAAAVELARADAVRAADLGPSALLEALHDAASAALAAGDRAAARALLEESAAEERLRGMRRECARDQLALADLDSQDGMAASAAIRALTAGELLEEAGSLAEAAEALRRAGLEDPSSEEIAGRLERVARELGEAGAPYLAEALAARAELAPPGPQRADALTRIAETLLDTDLPRATELLERARAEAPGAEETGRLLEEAWRRAGRTADLAKLLLDRAGAAETPEERRRLTRTAAGLLSGSPAEDDRARAAEAWADVFASDPADLGAARAAVDLLLALGRREEALPLLASIVRADPDDERSAQELAEAFAGRHRERAELFLSRAERAAGEPRAQRLREAARALFAAGDDRRARQLLRDAFDAWPADDDAFFAAIRDAAADIDRLDRVLAARAGAVPGEAAGCHRARADALLAFGREEEALSAWEAASAANPEDLEAFASWADCLAHVRGDEASAELDHRLVALSETGDGVPGALVAPSRYRLGLMAWAAGREAEGAAHLEKAVAAAPEHPSAGRALAALTHARLAAGDEAGALAAARRRADRAVASGAAEERSAAIEEGVHLVDARGATGPDAAALLVRLAELRLEAHAAPEELAPVVRRAAEALRATGEAERAAALLQRAGLPAEPPPPPGMAPGVDLGELERIFAAGPSAEGWGSAALALADHHRAAGEHREVAQIEAFIADASPEPAARARAWIRGAEALEKSGAPREEVDAALDIAAEADPDSPEPWLALAGIEQRRGDPVAAARAHLSVSIRAEGETAARSALEAARIFEQLERHEDAARAYRAAVMAKPGCVPALRVLAEEALAAGDVDAAAQHLLAIPPDEVPQEDRADHRRTVARILESAGRTAEAEGQWLSLFRDAPGDPEAFDHAGRLTLASGGLDAWLGLAAEHETALATRGETERRRDLRHQRGTLFAGVGRLEAARGAFLAALELDPGHSPSLEAMAALDGRRDEWQRAAGELAAEAARASDGAEAAATLVRRARILHERLGEETEALAALDEALVRARLSDGPAAERIAVEAEELLSMIGPARAARPAGPSEVAAPAAADPVAAVLRTQADAEEGAERAALLERLAGHLERSGATGAAADALLDALDADPDRELTWSWLLSIAAGDAARLERAAAIRARAGLEPMVASPEVKAVPPLDISQPETEPAAPAPPPFELPEPPGLGLEDFQFEPQATPPAAAGEPSFFFEPAPAAAEPPGSISLEPTLGLGAELPFDPFAPPMPGGEDAFEPEPMVDEFEPALGTWGAPSAAPTGEASAPPRLDEAEAGGGTAPKEETGPIRLDASIVASVPAAPPPPPVAPAAAAPPSVAAPDRVAAARAALVARWDAPPREQCALRRELGLALVEGGDLDGGIGALLGANAADPSDLETLEALARIHEEAGKEVEALTWQERAADLLEAGPERAVRLAELARKAEALGDRDRAVWLWERVRAADHRYRSALEALCRLYAAAGDRVQLRLVAAELSDVAGDGALEPWAAPLGRSWMDAGKPEVAYAWLQRALRADPTDLTIARDLSRIAERIGSWGEYVRLGEVCADAFASYDPLAAAARLRHFAEVLRDRLSDTERAAVMLEKALSLIPDDGDVRRDLLSLWSARPETAQRALEGWLDAVRIDPSDGIALVSLAETCRSVARELSPGEDALLLERARLAASLAAFINPALATAQSLKLASAVPEELRERVAVPGATGALARLLALLGPYLEPLFPADLARRGASPPDRLVSPRAPELRTALETAARALSARPYAAFLTSRASAELALENTQPPSVVAGAEVAGLPEASLAFLAARSFDLLGRGWALAGKFAPKDVAILLELACRFVGAPVPAMALPPQRADAFLAALQKTVPPTVRDRALELAPSAAAELGAFDPKRFTAAMRRTANRVAVLYTGDPGAALRALAASERRAEAAELDPVEALSLPDLRDLALFALSDPFLELRVSVTS